jgi:hypothetical protein
VREKLPPIVLELFAFSGAAASLGIARARGEARRAPRPTSFVCVQPRVRVLVRSRPKREFSSYSRRKGDPQSGLLVHGLEARTAWHGAEYAAQKRMGYPGLRPPERAGY